MTGGYKLVAFLTCCLMLKGSFSAPVSANTEQIQKLEERVEELTEKLKLLKEEAHHYTKRQVSSSSTILNENRKYSYIVA